MRFIKRNGIDDELTGLETYVANHIRLFISAAVALLVFAALIAVTVFFMAVRGAEQTMVPDVTGKELTAALLELQVKELYPRIQLRYSQTASEKGTILEQEPSAGSIVKAGRRIRLIVSRGVVVDRVEDYTGQSLDDVKMHLQTLFSTSSRPLLTLREPPMYQFSPEPAGIILEQKPEAGTEIDGPLQLEFIVSRGPENAMIKVPDLVGLPFSDAIEQIRQANIQFILSTRPAQDDESPETIVSQLPAGQSVVAANTQLNLVLSEPEKLEEGEVFGLLKHELPEYPYPLSLRLEALLPNGERTRLVDVKHPGGEFTAPYHLPEGSVLILTVLNREELRQEVQAPAQVGEPTDQEDDS